MKNVQRKKLYHEELKFWTWFLGIMIFFWFDWIIWFFFVIWKYFWNLTLNLYGFFFNSYTFKRFLSSFLSALNWLLTCLLLTHMFCCRFQIEKLRKSNTKSPCLFPKLFHTRENVDTILSVDARLAGRFEALLETDTFLQSLGA